MAAGQDLVLKMIMSMQDNASKQVDSLGKKLGGLASTAIKILAPAAAIGAVTKGLYDSVKAAAEEEKGIARLGAAVTASGGDWQNAKKDIDAYLASELKRVALDDGEGRDSLTRLTAATGDYKKAMELLPLAVDLAKAKNIDLASATEIVGKVANGNTGILGRYGITLEKGATATEALAEMQKRFAGQGEAYASTYEGQMQKLSITFGNIKETIGGALLPVINKLAEGLVNLLNSPAIQGGIDMVAGWLGSIPVLLAPVLPAFDVFKQALNDIVMGIGLLIQGDFPSFIELLGQAWAGLAGSLGVSQPIISGVYEAMYSVGDIIGAVIPLALSTLQGIWDSIFPSLQATADVVWGGIAGIISTVTDQVIPLLITVFGSMLGWVQANWPTIQNIITTVWQAVAEIIRIVAETVIPLVVGAFQTVVDWVSENWPRMQRVVETVMGAVLSVINAVITTVVPFIVEQFGVIKSWVDENWPLIQKTIETVLNAVMTVIETVLGVVTSIWETHGQNIMTVVNSAWTIIKTVIETALQTILGIIKAVMQAINGDWTGAWETIKGVATRIWKAIKTIVENELKMLKTIFSGGINAVINWFTTVIGKFVQAGTDIVNGIRKGIADAWQEFVEWLKRKVLGVVDSVAGWLGIGSPSKVFAEIGRNIVAGMQSGMGDQADRGGGGFSDMLTQFTTMFQQMAGLFWQLGSEMEWERVNTVLDTFGQLSDLLKTGGEALADAASYVSATGLREAVAHMIADLRMVLDMIIVFKDDLGRTTETALLMEQFGKIMAPFKTIVDGLKAISEYVHKAGLRETWNTLQEDFRMVVNWMQHIARMFDRDAVAAAATFADAAGRVLSPMRSVVDGLKAIGEYTHKAGLRGIWTTLQDDMRMVVSWMVHIAEMFDQDAVDAAEAFSGGAGGVLGVMKQAVDGLGAIGGYVHKVGLRAIWVTLVDDMRMVVNWVKDLAALFDQVAVDAAAAFMQAVGRVMQPLKSAVDGLAAIGGYSKQADIGTAVTWFIDDMNWVVVMLRTWAGFFDAEALGIAGDVMGAAGKIISPIKSAIDGLGAIAKYSKAEKLAEALDSFRADLKTAVEQIKLFAGDWDSDALTAVADQVGQWADDMDSIGDAVKGVSDRWVKDVAKAATAWKDAVIAAIAAIRDGIRLLQTLGSPTTPDLWQVGFNQGSRWVQGIVAGINSQLANFDAAVRHVLDGMGGGGSVSRRYDTFGGANAAGYGGRAASGSVTINLTYAPAVSFATAEEAYTRLTPVLREALRREGR